MNLYTVWHAIVFRGVTSARSSVIIWVDQTDLSIPDFAVGDIDPSAVSRAGSRDDKINIPISQIPEHAFGKFSAQNARANTPKLSALLY